MTRDSDPAPGTEHELESGEPASPELSGETRLAELEARAQELEARWLRAQADYQNLKRRAQAELETALLRTLQPLLGELLLALDYLDLALSASLTTPEAKNLAAGVQLTRAQLARALEAADVRTIPSAETFDPGLHEAAGQRPTDEVPPGTILATVRAGYTWQGRILRPARVVLACAPGASSSAEADPSEETS